MIRVVVSVSVRFAVMYLPLGMITCIVSAFLTIIFMLWLWLGLGLGLGSGLYKPHTHYLMIEWFACLTKSNFQG